MGKGQNGGEEVTVPQAEMDRTRASTIGLVITGCHAIAQAGDHRSAST